MTRIRLSTTRQPRRGFTLIELLVVISIIAVLVSLVAPAVQAARRTARKLQCLSNMRQVGIAMQAFSASTGNLPYLTTDLNTDSGNTISGVGWPMALLPALDNAVVLKNIKANPQTTTIGSNTYFTAYNPAQTTGSNNNIWIAAFTCPDDTDSDHRPGGLSFVVNAGFIPNNIWGTTSTNPSSSGGETLDIPATGSVMQNPYIMDWNQSGNYSTDGVQILGSASNHIWDPIDQAVQVATGVFFRATTGAGSNSFQPTLDYISTGDGQTNTLMLTENLNAGPWNGSAAYGNGVNHFGFGIALPVSNYQVATGASGIFQSVTSGAPPSLATENTAFTNTSTNPDFWMINRYINFGTLGSGIGPRPSSQHAGGVNVFYCDGRGGFLSENIDKQAYAKLCTSNGGTYGEYTLNNQY